MTYLQVGLRSKRTMGTSYAAEIEEEEEDGGVQEKEGERERG